MPDLRCTVQTCAHNKNFYCDLDGIVVGGNSAKRAEETCCDSFEERKGDSYSNVTGEASPKCKIDCKATDCMYNDQRRNAQTAKDQPVTVRQRWSGSRLRQGVRREPG